ncbi:CHAP domain-containing protein [Roseicella frigidaeris]|uniref:CHAP domain-containing protein n=1 Tax=Roseicella frigidaeris TaxID=2230885 RepID=A0A327MBP0_9PROT|nr:CHAP domain-containing protein [Roseicella frigidaeris]
MRVVDTTLAVCVAFGFSIVINSADAASTGRPAGHAAKRHPHAVATSQKHAHKAHRAARRGSASLASVGGISCVPYARDVTGMQIRGNGGDWWANAAGRYDRGQRPEPGSIMAFRSTNGMRLGHVAVVSRVLGPRHVLIDHANWGGAGLRKGMIMHNINVVDVSEANDWSAVRVQLGYDTTSFGKTYPTYGFIYNRPDDMPATRFAAIQPMQRSMRFEQLAEMPVSARPSAFETLADMTVSQASAARR